MDVKNPPFLAVVGLVAHKRHVAFSNHILFFVAGCAEDD